MEEYKNINIAQWSNEELLFFLFRKAEIFNRQFPKGTVLKLINMFSEDSFFEIPLFVDSSFVVDIKKKQVLFFAKREKEMLPTSLTVEDLAITTEIAKEMGKLNV